MNQQEIHKQLDKLLAQTESEIQEVFARRLKEILFRISEMYRKYGKGGEPSWTDMNKYNRVQKEMEVIAKMLNEDYKLLIKQINSAMQTQYVENYLQHAYLFQMAASTEMGFTIPSIAVVQEVIANPIAKLTLPSIFKQHRDDIIRKINIEISQGLIAGEGYAGMAERIRKTVGFSQKKARLVARTEAGRVRNQASEKAAEQANKHAKIGKVWQSSLDLRVRATHRALDGQRADKEGYFRYKGMKAKAPHLWGRAEMDINCRCVVLYTVNGILPEYRRGRDYMDVDYQRKLADRLDALMADEGLTYLQALKKAQKEIKPPSKTFKYVTFDEWKDKLAS